MQLDLFGTATATPAATPAAPAAPADVQLSLFRPNALDMRAPKTRGAKPAPIALDPTLHDGGLF